MQLIDNPPRHRAYLPVLFALGTRHNDEATLHGRIKAVEARLYPEIIARVLA